MWLIHLNLFLGYARAVSLAFKSRVPSSVVVLFINFSISEVIMNFISLLLYESLPFKHDNISLAFCLYD